MFLWRFIDYCEGDRRTRGRTVLRSRTSGTGPARRRPADPQRKKKSATVRSFGMCEDDVRLRHAASPMMVGSDATSMVIGGKTAEGKQHRATTATLSAQHRASSARGRHHGWRAIAKMTGRCAAKLPRRSLGTIEDWQEGRSVCSPQSASVRPRGHQEPQRYARGEMVVLNGRIVVDGARTMAAGRAVPAAPRR